MKKSEKVKKKNREKLSCYIAKRWYWYLLALGSMLLYTLLDVTAPLVIKNIVDDVIVAGKVERLTRLLAALVSIGAGRAIFGYVKEFIFDMASVGISRDMRRNLFRHIQSLDIRFFDRNNTGELLTRVKDDTDRVWNATGYVGMLAIEGIISTIGVVYCMFRLNPILTIVPLVITPLVAVTAVREENQLDKVYDNISEENAQLNTVAQENLSGVRTVRAFAREGYEIEKFRGHNGNYNRLNMRMAKLVAKYDPNITLLTRMLLMAVVLVGGVLVIRRDMTLGDLSAFTEYANNIIWPMELLGWLSNDLAAAFASNRKIKKILKEQPEITDPENASAPAQIDGRVEFEHVSLSIDGNEILSDISFGIEPGKTLGIMGMTGSGKSSIINLLERFYDASTGTVRLDGTDIRTLPLQTLRENVAVVMQEVFLFSDSIKENVRIGRRESLTDEQVAEAVRLAGAEEFVTKLSSQYDTVIGERGVGLSGGQKQRVSIARALAGRAPVLVFDDATSALDMETEYEIQKNLQQMTDVTKIIIAHRISAVRNADEIIVLDQGRIAERGTHEELLRRKGLYYDTFRVQYGNRLEGGIEYVS